MQCRLLFAFLSIGMPLLVVPAAIAQDASGRQQPASKHKAELARAVADARRSPTNRERDRYRNPAQTLGFFGVEPKHTVVEIWPGRGWYTEILAPYLAAGGGKLLLATPNGELGPVDELQQAQPAIYANIGKAVFPAFDPEVQRVPDGAADVVLTFRNVHNWRMGAGAEEKQDYSAEAFRQMFAMLKPGGILGVVDHRLPESASDERERNSGYVKSSTVQRLARQAGFRLVASSEVNANSKDTTEWPAGVWTLPPALRLKDEDRDKYLAIGESDRMTLKFVKPR